jgi:hypothetical protein
MIMLLRGLFDDADYGVKWYDQWWIINWKGYGW